MENAKQIVRKLLDRLPDDCTLADIQGHLSVVQAVERGRTDGRAGRVIPHDVVAAELRRTWSLGDAE